MYACKMLLPHAALRHDGSTLWQFEFLNEHLPELVPMSSQVACHRRRCAAAAEDEDQAAVPGRPIGLFNARWAPKKVRPQRWPLTHLVTWSTKGELVRR